jgi:hypothetical protein
MGAWSLELFHEKGESVWPKGQQGDESAHVMLTINSRKWPQNRLVTI